jgi:hypothetical protein
MVSTLAWYDIYTEASLLLTKLFLVAYYYRQKRGRLQEDIQTGSSSSSGSKFHMSKLLSKLELIILPSRNLSPHTGPRCCLRVKRHAPVSRLQIYVKAGPIQEHGFIDAETGK